LTVKSLFPSIRRICWSVCHYSHTRSNIRVARPYGWNGRYYYRLTLGVPVSNVGAAWRKMKVSYTPHFAYAERKRAERLEVARRLYKALVEQDPDRVIILYCGGRVVARHDLRHEQSDLRLPLRH
jgi:hypothetical protein